MMSTVLNSALDAWCAAWIKCCAKNSAVIRTLQNYKVATVRGQHENYCD